MMALVSLLGAVTKHIAEIACGQESAHGLQLGRGPAPRQRVGMAAECGEAGRAVSAVRKQSNSYGCSAYLSQACALPPTVCMGHP